MPEHRIDLHWRLGGAPRREAELGGRFAFACRQLQFRRMRRLNIRVKMPAVRNWASRKSRPDHHPSPSDKIGPVLHRLQPLRDGVRTRQTAQHQTRRQRKPTCDRRCGDARANHDAFPASNLSRQKEDRHQATIISLRSLRAEPIRRAEKAIPLASAIATPSTRK